MIKTLHIQNYALIQSVTIQWSEYLNIVTGETGSGKSILLDALGLLLGNKAESNILHNPNEKCIIEAFVEVSCFDIQHFFDGLELENTKEIILRREILPSGKSRAFVNDHPILLHQLKDFSTHLVDIHSQNQTQSLTTSTFQLEILDLVANTTHITKKYQRDLATYKGIEKNIQELEKQKQLILAQKEFNSFLLEELNKAEPKPEEEITLEAEQQLLENASEIQLQLTKSYYILQEQETSISEQIREIQTGLQGIAKFDPSIQEIYTKFQTIAIEIKDISKEIEKMTNQVAHNPQRLSESNERLDILYRLFQKHKVKTSLELINIQQNLNNQLFSSEIIEEKLHELYLEKQKTYDETLILATTISKKRAAVKDDFAANIAFTLSSLGMPSASISILLSTATTLNTMGIDEVTYLFSANKGHAPKELSKVASGGELSRLMLVIKYLVAKATTLPTMIFDEIDTGTSGNVANKIGDILEEMSANMQIISITHLPQIASKGHKHYKVYKNQEMEKAQTFIKELNTEDRIQEIAAMLSGKELTEVAIKNAQHLLRL